MATYQPAVAAENNEDLPTWLDLAGPPDPVDRAIQRRKYALHHELSLLVGGLPVDPFYKGYTGTAGYTYHFSDYIGWEVGAFTYSYNRDTDLKEQFFQTVTGSAALPSVNYFVTSHLVVKPFYGKEALLDYTLAHVEAFVQAGPALLGMKESFNTGMSNSGFAFGVDAGFGLRLWLHQNVSLRASLSDLFYFFHGRMYQGLNANVGLGLNFGADE